MEGIYMSFMPDFYKKIAGQLFRRSWLFLMLFILIISGFIAVRSSFNFSSMASFGAKAFSKFWEDEKFEFYPQIEIKDGQLAAPIETFIREYKPVNNIEMALAIEPDPMKANVLLDKYPNILLITKNKVIAKNKEDNNSSELKEYSLLKVKYFKLTFIKSGINILLEGNKSLEITGQTLNKWLKIARFFSFPVFWLFLFLGFNISKILYVLVFSLVSMAVNSLIKAPLNYKQLLNIGVYALVPPTIIAAFIIMFNSYLPGLIYCGVYILYLYLGIKANKAN